MLGGLGLQPPAAVASNLPAANADSGHRLRTRHQAAVLDADGKAETGGVRGAPVPPAVKPE